MKFYKNNKVYIFCASVIFILAFFLLFDVFTKDDDKREFKYPFYESISENNFNEYWYNIKKFENFNDSATATYFKVVVSNERIKDAKYEVVVKDKNDQKETFNRLNFRQCNSCQGPEGYLFAKESIEFTNQFDNYLNFNTLMKNLQVVIEDDSLTALYPNYSIYSSCQKEINSQKGATYYEVNGNELKKLNTAPGEESYSLLLVSDKEEVTVVVFN